MNLRYVLLVGVYRCQEAVARHSSLIKIHLFASNEYASIRKKEGKRNTLEGERLSEGFRKTTESWKKGKEYKKRNCKLLPEEM